MTSTSQSVTAGRAAALPGNGSAGAKPSLRRGLLVQTLLTVLRDASQPVPPAEALRLVEEALPLTAHEASPASAGVRRAETFVRFASSWATALGWMTKKGGWALTEAGAAALAELPDPDALYSTLTKRYRAELRKREPVSEPNPKWATVRNALSLVDAGSWTTYGDLADLVSLPPLTVGQFIAGNPVPNAHRVLRKDGRISPDFAWTDPARHDDPRELLVAEGVEFDGDGRADPRLRVDAVALRELLGDVVEASLSRRAWLVRGSSVNGVNLVPMWVGEGWCSLAASHLRDVSLPLSGKEIADIVEEDYQHVSYNARAEKKAELDAFLNRMQVDDLVSTTSEGALYVGRVAGDAAYETSTDARSNLRRDVEWLNTEEPVDFADLPPSLKARLSSQHTVVDLTQDLAAVEALVSPQSPGPVARPPGTVPEATLPDVTGELAEALLVPREWLQECIELLRDRRQLIFYGPPGTGKTYLAQAIAEHVAPGDAVKLVQFHPAYSYEDFFEGFRPAAGADGTVAFTLTPGPFRRLVDAARENPGTAYVLIVDEINRANLAKVFGELYFLLEYRDRSIDLLYSAGDEAGFTLPPNVYLIGTMNTADRSIALVDAAMRRRFAFVPLHPSEPPTSGDLDIWLDKSGRSDETARLLDALNARISDSDFKIGPSYLMRDAVYADGGLERVWRTAILPLLEEHHYGEGIDVGKRYGLAGLLKAIAPVAEEVAADADEPTVEGEGEGA